MKYRVVVTSNFGSETFSEFFRNDELFEKDEAENFAELLNLSSPSNDPIYWIYVEDGYKLDIWNP